MFFYCFEYPSVEIKQNCSSANIPISLKSLDKVFWGKIRDDSHTICICSKSTLDLSKEYFPYFLSMSGGFRKTPLTSENIKGLFDKKAWDDIFDFYANYIDFLEENFPGSSISLNLSFGDYCVLVPVGVNFDFNAFDQKIGFICNNKEKIWDTNNKLINNKIQISNRFNSQHIYKYLPHYDECEKLFSELLNAYIDTEERGFECVAYTCNLLSWFLDELNVHLFHKNGEFQNFDSDLIEDLETPTEVLIDCFSEFLKQIKIDNPYCDQIWSFLFITKSLLFTLLGSRNTDDEVSEFKRYDFSGFVPIVSQNIDTMDSSFTDLFAPQRTFAFLHIPNSNNFNFWLHLPAFMHEFFHYVPTDNRKERNDVIIRLTLQTAINVFINELTVKCDTCKTRTTVIVDYLFERYKSTSYLNTFNEEKSPLNEDSMFFLAKNRELFAIFDFESIYEAFPDVISMSDAERNVHAALRTDCLERWDSYAKSYLQTYTMAFREIRADIAMCILLEIDLKEYVRMMALEPTWSKYDANQTADSSIVRFGFITRYLFFRQNKRINSFETAEHFNVAYDNEMKNICLNLKQQNLNIEENIDNILGYVKEYFDIMIESNNGYYTEQHHSEFEAIVYPAFQQFGFSETAPSIVEAWEQYFDECRSYNLFSDVKEIYKKYHQYIEEAKYEEAVKLNYQSRLVLRDLTLYCDHIHELGKNLNNECIKNKGRA